MILFRLILATDMSNHKQILSKFVSVLNDFDITNPEHKIQVKIK